MKVFKFGGASVKDPGAIRNIASIIKATGDSNLLVVVSAMGKTTNALEKIIARQSHDKDFEKEFADLHRYHFEILTGLFPKDHSIFNLIEDQFSKIRTEAKKNDSYDLVYDQVVSMGEVISTLIVANYLEQEGMPVEWTDARKMIKTDKNFREGKVDWDKSKVNIRTLNETLTKKILITQGFIGSTEDGLTTTLGREGSDYSAAIFASCLRAESVTIWKDVPGVMNADPKRLPAAIVFEELPFREAAEMTYYGASVIHPKTIKPLANNGIPLFVKNFDNPLLPGTVIKETKLDHIPPLIVFKDNQCLISCRVTDYSFIEESQLSIIFGIVSEMQMKINLMQNSAISFSFCVDYREDKIIKLIDLLGKHFEVYYNTGLTLITVKNYDQQTVQEYRQKKGVILEQSSRSTLQVLIK
jgi:aspartate kinase